MQARTVKSVQSKHVNNQFKFVSVQCKRWVQRRECNACERIDAGCTYCYYRGVAHPSWTRAPITDPIMPTVFMRAFDWFRQMNETNGWTAGWTRFYDAHESENLIAGPHIKFIYYCYLSLLSTIITWAKGTTASEWRGAGKLLARATNSCAIYTLFFSFALIQLFCCTNVGPI